MVDKNVCPTNMTFTALQDITIEQPPEQNTSLEFYCTTIVEEVPPHAPPTPSLL